jgi:hypothetical protein
MHHGRGGFVGSCCEHRVHILSRIGHGAAFQIVATVSHVGTLGSAEVFDGAAQALVVSLGRSPIGQGY